MTRNTLYGRLWQDEDCGAVRRGSFMTLGLFCLVACMTFVAFSVDVGMISLTQTRMQNAVDSAALAAAMEITWAVENAGEDVEDVLLFAKSQAAGKAVEVAALNGVFVDPDADVSFGHRTFNEGSQQWQIIWGASPPNVVKVVARRDNEDVTAPDGKLQMLFAGVNGDDSATIKVSAVAYVEARDIVTVLDFSRSMNFDSFFTNEYLNPDAYRPQAEIEANMLKVWQDLGSPQWGNMPFVPDWVTVPTSDGKVQARWRDNEVDVNVSGYSGTSGRIQLQYTDGTTTSEMTLKSGWNIYKGTGSQATKLIRLVRVRTSGSSWQYTIDFYNNTDIRRGLGLSGVAFPSSPGSWDQFIDMCRAQSSSEANGYYQAEIGNKGYRRKFGSMLMVQYMLRYRPGAPGTGNPYGYTPGLWQTRHYPFTSVKNGQQLFCTFLDNLSFGDEIGLVSYDTSHRVEMQLSGSGMPTIDISSDPITSDYSAISTIIEHKQAAHYNYATNMGGGLKDAKWLLDNYKRVGARPTILLMTDGNTNTMDSGESATLPAGWNWDTLFDYNGDGVRDFETSNSQHRYVLKIAKECVDAGFTIHCMSVGADANTELMKAIAWIGRGIYIEVPGGTSVEEMEEDVHEAFRRIAAFVPPAKLLNPAE